MYIYTIPQNKRFNLIVKKQFMFGLFKKKTKKEKLQDQYEKLLKEAYLLSSTNRKMSDQKTFEANEVLEQIDKLS